jgi:predicted nucleic acid-binding protein
VTSDAKALVDTGFLVAVCDRRDSHHQWAAATTKSLRGPWLTCEACICEADHLLDYIVPPQSHWLYDLLQSGALQSQHLLPEQLARVHSEIARYRDRRVDFADACLVMLSDDHPKLPVVTTDDTDFSVYFRSRSHRRLVTSPK